jgi:AcrR family transcriptional regulator
MTAFEELLRKVVTFASDHGIADKSLREIAVGVGTSHRMLLYHFGSREGLMAAIVKTIEERQRAVMTSMAARSTTPKDLMTGLWGQVSGPQLRPFVRLFFEVFGLAVQGAAGTESLLEGLTNPWLEDASSAAAKMGSTTDPIAMRLGVAVSRGLLLDLLAGADEREVDAAHELFVDLVEGWLQTRAA